MYISTFVLGVCLLEAAQAMALVGDGPSLVRLSAMVMISVWISVQDTKPIVAE